MPLLRRGRLGKKLGEGAEDGGTRKANFATGPPRRLSPADRQGACRPPAAEPCTRDHQPAFPLYGRCGYLGDRAWVATVAKERAEEKAVAAGGWGGDRGVQAAGGPAL